MFKFIQKLFGSGASRRAMSLVLHGSGRATVDLLKGVDFLIARTTALNLPQADWITCTYYAGAELSYQTSKFSSWIKKRSVPGGMYSIELGSDIKGKSDFSSFTDWVWRASVAQEGFLDFHVDGGVVRLTTEWVNQWAQDAQVLGSLDYGYAFEMDVKRCPPLYVLGSSFNSYNDEAAAKWGHTISECKKLGLSVSDLLRDIYPLNFINPRHLTMEIKGQSLKDWIEADTKRGTLKPLTAELWTWQVPENRIQAIRKVLGPERLLVSWGGFNTPSGGPLGHTYGAKTGKPLPSPFNGLPLTEDERCWIAEGLAAMKPIFERYTAQKPKDFERLIGRREALFGKLLDTAFTAWSEDLRPDKASPELALQAFAATLGEHLVKHFDMAWYALEDEYGRSLGVAYRGKDGAQTWAYPVDSVAKRIDKGETGFIHGVVETVGNEIKRG